MLSNKLQVDTFFFCFFCNVTVIKDLFLLLAYPTQNLVVFI